MEKKIEFQFVGFCYKENLEEVFPWEQLPCEEIKKRLQHLVIESILRGKQAG